MSSPVAVVVVGIGNVLLRDDGAGIWLVRRLVESYCFTPTIDIIDGGTLGLALLSQLAGGRSSETTEPRGGRSFRSSRTAAGGKSPAPLLFKDEQPPAAADPVSKALPSEQASAKPVTSEPTTVPLCIHSNLVS